MQGKIKLVSLAVIALTATINANAQSNGCTFGEKTLPGLTCYGQAVLKKTIVTANMQIEGGLQGNDVTLDAMTIDGPVVLHESTVKGMVDIDGELNAHKVAFEKNVALASAKAVLSESSLDGSLVMTSKETKPMLRVECGTKITGNVTFVGKPGVVQLTDDSDVAGKIVNGDLEFVDKDCQKMA